MPAIDNCQAHIVRALQKDGWQVFTPKYLKGGGQRVYIDIEAIKSNNGTQGARYIYVEVKCFEGREGRLADLYVAFGQYLMYRTVISMSDDQRPLYLTVPEPVYLSFDAATRRTIDASGIKLLVVNLDMEQIVSWIE